ncbi:hypothetical protein SOCEGT47_046030 [Sorangium cellulosum]|uniref:DUF985 domain-containing protein n=1 Tax=Sorangium cellulosum TaxID=56 RepID=A0A4P2Q3Y2_SORCE|nr:cupin domain-containing protein [Sorangium cellulosum]AUX24070.1 hypothetical protein SOCEGT47_046030 [Sorangium cellulosum]
MRDARELIESLGLIPHPEGGYFREVFRSGSTPMTTNGLTDPAGSVVQTDRAPPERNVLTSIYWLLDRSRPVGYWCMNLSDHVHYYHAGAALTYSVIHPDGRLETQRLGPDLRRGDVMQFVVRGGCWKASHLEEGDYCLIGEAVAPGFDFRDFHWGVTEELVRAFPGVFASNRRLLDYVKPDARRNFEDYYERQG